MTKAKELPSQERSTAYVSLSSSQQYAGIEVKPLVVAAELEERIRKAQSALAGR